MQNTMKKFKDMTDQEFSKYQRIADKQPLGSFAKFCIAGKGYEFRKRNSSQILYKWELFTSGYDDMEKILAGKTDIVATVKKPEPNFI